MIRTIIILAVFFTATKSAMSQFNETIRTGRPGQAIGPFTAGKNVLQFQQGIDINKTEIAGTITKSIQQNNIIRWGFTRTFEMSGVLNYQQDDIDNGILKSRNSGLQNVQIGVRYNVVDEPRGIIPGIGYQVRIKLPLGADIYKPENPGVVMILGTTNKISPNISFTSNWIMSLNGNSPVPDYNYVLNLSFPLSAKMGGFIEHYAGFGNGNFIPQFDAGISYLINNDLQFDLYGGFDLKEKYKSSFISTGISWRLKTKKE